MARLAYSLETLRSQINAAYPKRNKASDGWIGDAKHAARPSDHNPNAQGVVCGLDITDHPGYLDIHALADHIRLNRHPNLKYIISNRRIASAKDNWKWRPYTGTNPHSKHVHFSVGVGTDGKSKPGTYDDSTPWKLQKAGNEMSADNLTEYEVKELYKAYFGIKNPPAYNFKHVGQPLKDLIAQFRVHQDALMNKESLGQIGPVDQILKEKLYNDQIAATKKVFNKE